MEVTLNYVLHNSFLTLRLTLLKVSRGFDIVENIWKNVNTQLNNIYNKGVFSFNVKC